MCSTESACLRAGHTSVKQKRLFENQPVLGRCREPVELLHRRVRRGKVRREQGGISGRQPQSNANRFRKQVRQVGRQPLERLVHKSSLHLGRDAARLLVDRHDSPGVNRLPVLVVQDLVLRVGQLQSAGAAHLDGSEQHDVLSRRKHVPQKRLVEPRDANRPGAIVDRGVENLEARTSRRAQAAAEQPAGHRRRLAGLERRDALQTTAVFVPDRKPCEQILEGDQSDALEVGGAAGPDALQKLKRRREHLVGRIHRMFIARRSPDRG